MSSKSSLVIKQYEIGPLNNFLYLLGDESTKEMAMVDPAWDVPFLCEEVKKMGFKITKVFLTHAHPDHVNGLDELLSYHNVPVYISKYEAPALRKNLKNLVDIKDKEKLSIGQATLETIHTPGHTPGCQCFFFDGNLISGDTLFIDGCGRCDLPGGDARVMYHSLYNILMKLPNNTILYPGHNYGPIPTDTIGGQKKTNPYLQSNNLEEFLTERMGL